MKHAADRPSRSALRLPRTLSFAALFACAALAFVPFDRSEVARAGAEPPGQTVREPERVSLASTLPPGGRRREIESDVEAEASRVVGLYGAEVGRRLDYAFYFETSVRALPAEGAIGSVEGEGTVGCRVSGLLRAQPG